MGCDIHGFVEVNDGAKWVAVCELKSDERNYLRFARLAGVRGDGPRPSGMPDDASDTTMYHINIYGRDGHSHGSINIKQASEIWLDTMYGEASEYQMKYPESAFFDVEDYYPFSDTARLVFWFDN